MSKFRSLFIRHIERLHTLGVAVAVMVISGLELALAERKFGILFGGFGAGQTINTPARFVAVFAQWLPVQVAAILLLHILLRVLLGKRWNGVLALLICWGGMVLIPAALLFAKYQVLQYFGDALGLDLMRRLGGGSLWDAFLYIGSEIVPLLLGTLVALAALVWLVLMLLRQDIPAATTLYRPGKGKWLTMGALVAASAGAMVLVDDARESKYLAHRFMAPALLRNTVSALTDWDGDGYGYLALQTDPMPFDASIYPLAYDVPDNGIDEDGYCGDFSLAAHLKVAQQTPAPDPAVPLAFKHLVLVVLESTRADVLVAQVDGKPVTPHLRQLADAGSATRAYSHAGFTVPSLISLFTGTLEPHSARQSLFDDFKSRGFHLGVLSGQAESFGDIDSVTHMSKQADFFVDAESLQEKRIFSSTAKGSLRIDEKDLFAAFESHYGKPQDWAQSNFIYLNFQAAHFPYYHSGMGNLINDKPLPRNRITPDNREQLVRTYLNAVAWSDHWLGEIVNKLQQLGVQKDVLLVVTGDHGESLFDQGFLGHGNQISDIQTQVPLVLSQPGVRLEGAIGLMDVRRLVLNTMAGTPVQPKAEPVFQYVGGLDLPAMIGLVDNNGNRITLDTTSTNVQFGADYPGGTQFGLLTNARRAQACELIHTWESHRYLGRQPQTPRHPQPAPPDSGRS